MAPDSGPTSNNERPASVRRAFALVWVLIAMFGLAAVLTIIFRDDLVRTWAEGNPTAEQILAESGVDGLDQSSIQVPAFVPLAVVAFIVVLLGGWVLASLFAGGYGWARWCLVGLLVFSAFASALLLTRQVPAIFEILAALAVPVQVACICFLAHRDTSRFVHGF